MYKTSLFLVGVLSVMVVCGMFYITVYEDLVYKLAWSAETEHLNFVVQRGARRVCGRFGIC